MFDDDGELERELRGAERLLDPVPAHLLRRAVDAFDWRTIDAELAELVFDSLTARENTLVRGPEQPRLLTFQAGARSIEVEVAGVGTARRIVGRLIPAEPVEIEIRHGDRQVIVTADDLGRFIVSSPGSGPLGLRCRPTSGTAPRQIVTEWVST